MTNMKYIGIDYGSKRVGIALSDADCKVAFPKEVIENNENFLVRVLEYVKKEKVEAVVLGESKNFKGEDNLITKDIQELKKNLEKEGIKVIFEPEFMSSVQVERNFGKNEMLDASSAAIILQSFLDKTKNNVLKEKEKEDGVLKIDYETFSKIEMKIGKILSAVPVEKSEKLIKLSVDFGKKNENEQEIRQIVSGIALYFPDTQSLVGRKVAFVTNLQPRKLMGLESNGMILAVKSGEKLALMEVPDFIEEGSKLS